MINDNVKNFVTSKIPTLIIIGSFLTIGAYLTKGEQNFSTNTVIGIIFLALGGLFAILTYSDYKNRESYEKTIETLRDVNQNLESNVNTLSKALNNLNYSGGKRNEGTSTNSLLEKEVQNQNRKKYVTQEDKQYTET